jgi:hypothetical protein
MDEVLVNYLLGEATTDEQQIVEQWLNESNENKKYFESLKAVWEYSKHGDVKTAVHADEAWTRLSQRMNKSQPVQRVIFLPYFLRVAAMLLLFVGIGWLVYSVKTKDNKHVVSNQDMHDDITPAIPERTITEQKSNVSIDEPIKPSVNNMLTVSYADNKKKSTAIRTEDCSARKFACNSTPCPLEICIIQRSTCQNMPFSISNCSRIEPDQAGQLCYKPTEDKVYENCALQVEEIRIKRVTTGETIVLDAHSSPVTAQEFFHYMTGEKKGDIVAGVFDTECNDDNNRGLSIDNYSGNLLFR